MQGLQSFLLRMRDMSVTRLYLLRLGCMRLGSFMTDLLKILLQTSEDDARK
jgi:hypothetical protein